MKMLRRQEGSVKVILILVILVAASYVGFLFGWPYFNKAGFQQEVQRIMQMQLDNVDRVRVEALESAHKHHIPIEDEDLKVELRDRKVFVRTAWSVTVDVLGFYQKKLDFTLDEEL